MHGSRTSASIASFQLAIRPYWNRRAVGEKRRLGDFLKFCMCGPNMTGLPKMAGSRILCPP